MTKPAPAFKLSMASACAPVRPRKRQHFFGAKQIVEDVAQFAGYKLVSVANTLFEVVQDWTHGVSHFRS